MIEIEDGALLLPEVARLLRTSSKTVQRRLKEGTFPIQPLPSIDKQPRWSASVVRRWLDRNGGNLPAPKPRRRGRKG